MAELRQPTRNIAWYLDREGRLCYWNLRDGEVLEPAVKKIRTLDGLAPTLFELEQVVKGSDFLWREYKRLTDVLIDGEYIGPLRGETNCALNVAHFLVCFLKVAEKELPKDMTTRLREMAYASRKQRWPQEFGW